MWGVQDPQRYARALKASHRVSSRVEIWSEGKQVDEASFQDGQVTDTWVACGVRRSLDLTVEPSRAWLRYLAMPLLEVRPFRGITFSKSVTMECPLGRFPVVNPDMAHPVSAIKINADDYYQRIMQADFSYPVQTETRRVVDAIVDLFVNVGAPFAGLPDPVVLTKSQGITNGVVLDKTRNDALVDYAKSFGLEVFIDRLGAPTIGDAQVLGAARSEVLVGGTAEAVAVKQNDDKIYNQVSVTSNGQDVNFEAQVAVITDPFHPAAQWRIGARVLKYQSALLLTAEDGMAAAQSILTKVSAAARTYTYTCVPDVRRDAGDSILGAMMTGSEVVQIHSVTHPLRASDRQSITTISTQPTYA
jgi:hypothetical protein